MEVLRWSLENSSSIADILKKGNVVVLPTDTLYGLVGLALSGLAFKEIFTLKKRNPQKKLIVLIADLKDLEIFDIVLTSKQKEIIGKLWPGPYSLELPCFTKKYGYLLCGTHSLSFRCPDNDLLRSLIRETGPLVAPSANPEGRQPAKNIEEAQRYFGELVPLYVDGGEKVSEPSTLLSLLGENIGIIRGSLPLSLQR